VIVNSKVIGTPWAVPLDAPKLERRSLRTMPLWSSTSGPLEPSPGYGPAVSSGISDDAAAALEPVVALLEVELEEVPEDVPEDVALPLVPTPQAARPRAAAPRPAARSICRRPIRVPTSKLSP
jgi:hypothetical protein